MMKKIFLTLLFCLLLSVNGYSACTGLPKTQQTTSKADYDDGYYQKGWAGTRFTDNSDGTITDNATGLMWAQDGDGAGCNNGATISWANAITFCEGLDFASHTDWRLPNINELSSITDHSTSEPSLNTTYFTDTQAGAYWTSTFVKYYEAEGYKWQCKHGTGSGRCDENTGAAIYVRCVRGQTGGGGSSGCSYTWAQ